MLPSRPLPHSTFIAAVAAWVLAGTRTHASEYPKVSLGNLDGRPGIAVIELTPSMSLAYDSEGAGLWMAWQGTASNEEAGPGIPAGPSLPGGREAAEARLRRDGPLYHTRRAAKPWSALRGGRPLPVAASIQQVVVEAGLPKVTYALRIGPDTIRVVEYPEFNDHYGAGALFRYFVFTGVPAGTEVRLELRGRLPREGEKPRFLEEGPEFLAQEGNGKKRVKVSWPKMDWGAGW